jgi:choline dehydrogenase
VKRATPNATFVYDPTALSATPRGGGSLDVSWANWVDPTQTWLAKALQSIGLSLSNIGLNSGVLCGGAWSTTTISPERAVRSSSETSYLRKAIAQTEITVYVHTQARKTVFNGNKEAVGVSVDTQGLSYPLSAREEVILSAGLFHFPQLLMVSGKLPLSIYPDICVC